MEIRGLYEAIQYVENQFNNSKFERAKRKLLTGKDDLVFTSDISTQKGLYLELVEKDGVKEYKIVCPLLDFNSMIGKVHIMGASVIHVSRKVIIFSYDIKGLVPLAVIGDLFIYQEKKYLFGVVRNEFVFIMKCTFKLKNICGETLEIKLRDNTILDFSFKLGDDFKLYSFSLSLEDYSFISS